MENAVLYAKAFYKCLLVTLAMTMQVATTPAAGAAVYAPLNCAKAQSPSETTICKSYALGQDEARMATLYALTTALVAMGQRGEIRDQQQAFLMRREACGTDAGCIRNVYAQRIEHLNAVMSGIISRGPF